MKNSSAGLAVGQFVLHYQCERPLDWEARFGRRAPLEVEIGFGLGEYLLRSARERPDHDFVGIELDWQRIKKALGKVGRPGSGAENIRILKAEARVALSRLFRPESVWGFSCLFPCPWPKDAHVKHRLFTRSFFRLMNSRLRMAGTVHIVTDFEPYYSWMLAELEGAGFQVNARRVAPKFDTKFEKKWREEGQEIFYELMLVKDRHQDVPLEEDLPLKVYFIPAFDPERFSFQDLTGCPAVVLKDFLYDPSRHKGMVHLVVAEATITQHLWVVIVRTRQGWCVAVAEGQTVLPTPGIVLAVQRVAETAERGAVEDRSIDS